SPVAVATDGGVYLGWRQLGLDPDSIAFHVYRDGRKITTMPVTTSTTLLDASGTEASVYRVSSVVDGIERWATGEFRVWDSQHVDVPLDKPAHRQTKTRAPYTRTP